MGRSRGWWLLYAVCGGILFFLVIPSVIVIPLSFSDSMFLRFPPRGFSLRWYKAFFGSPVWMDSLWLSVKLGIAVSIAATMLGVTAALGLVRGRFRGKGLVQSFLLSPMIVPVVVTGLAMYYFFADWRLIGNPIGLFIAHTCLATPIVIVIVSATLSGVNPNLEYAAQILGATPISVLLRIVFPVIGPGVLTGALFAFVMSFDEVVVAAFIGGYRTATLPKRMFENVRDETDPTVAAISTFLVLVSVVLLIVVGYLNRRRIGVQKGG